MLLQSSDKFATKHLHACMAGFTGNALDGDEN